MGRVIVLLGVSGSGKTAIGARLATILGGRFVEGDDYHCPRNAAKMERGAPLTDEERRPWLASMAADVEVWQNDDSTVVLACSALRRSYRDRLRAADRALWLVHLSVSPDLLRRRLAERSGHFMPASLLQSQLEILEPLDEAEQGATICIEDDESPQDVACRIARILR